MNWIGGGILVLGLGLSVVAAECEGPDQPATPAAQFKALLKEYETRVVERAGRCPTRSGWSSSAACTSSGTSSR